jgi:hypothetical protein
MFKKLIIGFRILASLCRQVRGDQTLRPAAYDIICLYIIYLCILNKKFSGNNLIFNKIFFPSIFIIKVFKKFSNKC